MPIDYQGGVRLISNILLNQGRSVVPLYTRQPAGQFKFLGSSVYVKQGNVELIFTARHVVELASPSLLWYPHSDTQMRVLPCDGFHTPIETSQDVCAAQLASGLPMWIPLAYGDLDSFQSYREYQHLLVGFPGSLATLSSDGGYRAKVMGYLTSPSPESEYTRLGVEPTKEFVVHFMKEKVHDENQRHTNFPDPNGMSGGAVLQFNENIPQLVSLVGIMTRWDINRKNAIIGAKIELIKNLFSLVELKLRPSMDA